MLAISITVLIKKKSSHLQLGVKRCVLDPGVLLIESGSVEHVIESLPCMQGAVIKSAEEELRSMPACE